MPTDTDPGRNRVRELAESFFTKTETGFSVDWKRHWRDQAHAVGNYEFHQIFKELLLARGIISEEPEGHFLVVVNPPPDYTDGVNVVGPFDTSLVSRGMVWFFTDLVYAREWLMSWPGYQKSEGDCYIIAAHVVNIHFSPAKRTK